MTQRTASRSTTDKSASDNIVRTFFRAVWLLVFLGLVAAHVGGGWWVSERIRDDALIPNPTPAAEAEPSPLSVEMVQYSTPIGDMDAWYLPGSRNDWVIHIHGKGSTPAQAVPLMDVLDDDGYHQLSIWYRNDDGQPADPSGYHQYGRTEVDDVAGAVAYARDNGAESIAIVGNSYGGGMAVAYALRDFEVDALVLDAPSLSLSDNIALGASQEELPLGLPVPPTVTAAGQFFAGLRFSINFQAIDYLRRGGQMVVPTLILHGTEDDVVPYAGSAELQDLRPDGQIVLVPFEGADHGDLRSFDQERYDSAIRSFLATELS